MTVNRCLVYAKGGGNGHQVRGEILASWLHEAGKDVELVLNHKHEKKSIIPVLDRVPKNKNYEHVFIDTFPNGFKDELIDARLMFKSSRLTLISRYSRLEPWTFDFDDFMSPYPDFFSEWEEKKSSREYFLGWMARNIDFQLKLGKLLVLNTGGRIHLELMDKMVALAENLGYETQVMREWGRDTIFQAEKVFIVGAGYNTFYEWLRTDADLKFLPLLRRWDDQHRRARSFNLELSELSDWIDWLKRPVQSRRPKGSYATLSSIKEIL